MHKYYILKVHQIYVHTSFLRISYIIIYNQIYYTNKLLFYYQSNLSFIKIALISREDRHTRECLHDFVFIQNTRAR